jgi:hypothetical protein
MQVKRMNVDTVYCEMHGRARKTRLPKNYDHKIDARHVMRGNDQYMCVLDGGAIVIYLSIRCMIQVRGHARGL